MTKLLSPNAKQQFFTDGSTVAAGYLLHTYLANTTTDEATYSNRAGSVANANPIVLDARGEATVYLTPGVVYDYVLKTPLGATVWTREDVSAQAGDADAISVTQTGTGAKERTLQANKELELNLMDYVSTSDDAGVLAGTTDCSLALSAALDEAILRGRVKLKIPAGRFLIGTALSKTLTTTGGLCIEGAGMGLTQLIMADATGNGLTLNAAAGDGNWWLNVDPSSAIRIANLSILATANNLGAGLKINGNSLEGRPPAPVSLDHVEIRAKDSINSQAFLIGLHLFDAASVFLSKCRFIVGGTSNLTPTAVKIEATDATTDPTSIYFDNCEWFYGGKGIVSGDHVEGVYLTNCSMVKVDKGVEWTCTAESGLHVVGGHYNCLSYNFDLNGVYDFGITGTACLLSGGAPMSHIRVQNGSSWTITGNSFQAGTTGIEVGVLPNTTRGAYIGGNQFGNMTTGISINANSYNLTVGPNAYTSVTTRVSGSGNAGTHVQKRSYSVSTAPTLVGGATSENVNVPIPAGVFLAKPSVIVTVAEAGTSDLIITPSFGTATATNVTCRVVKRDGTNLAAGAARLHMVAYE